MEFDKIKIESNLAQVVGLYGLYIEKIQKIFNDTFQISTTRTVVGNGDIQVIMFPDKNFLGEVQSILFDFKNNDNYVEIIIDRNSIHLETISKLIDTISKVIEDFVFVQHIHIIETKINVNDIKKLDCYLQHYEL